MIIRLNDTRFCEYMKECGYGYYSIEAARRILENEDELNPNWELEPVVIASTYTEYEPRDLINDFGYVTEAGGYSYLQVQDMTEEEVEDIVEEILENIKDQHNWWRIDQEGTILVEGP